VDTPGMYLSYNGSAAFVVSSLSAGADVSATWLIYQSNSQWAFVNKMSLNALTVSTNAVYVLQTAPSDLANQQDNMPTAAAAAGQEVGFASAQEQYNPYSPSPGTLFTVIQNLTAHTGQQTGNPEVVLYCPCCAAGNFTTFDVGGLTGVPHTFTTDKSLTYTADQCYLDSATVPSDIFAAPVVAPGEITVTTQSGQMPTGPPNPSLVMACCFQGGAVAPTATGVPAAPTATGAPAATTAPPTTAAPR